ncbi:MATE family efflux transporter [Lachnoclostridium sp. An131]|uniref:MATE family efflux transporter n=1 Tax=Lachnoclostridium sp. An131 TaxID=1965555 RepID=UPI000B38471C|nr:MATE family efflux transporter [Lachnoclostridium sp. An131]OUQ24260.1 MATE family efflux transporter [Lachnoclostridium sp. An131]
MKHTNDLGHDPVFPLVLRLAVPTMLAQLVNVLYSIVDRMYIGAGVGSLALAGVGVCAPIVTLLSSFGSLVGMGGSPLMAMRMGEGNTREARRILNNGFLMLLVLSVILTIVFLFSKEHLLMWFGASQATFAYADTYMTIYTAGTFFALMAGGMNSFLIAQGFSGLGMATVMLGAVLNIVLDPVFIFVFDMGVAGAAIATVISQIASCAFVLLTLWSRKMPVRLSWGDFRWKTVQRIAAFGLSPFLIIASDSILLIVLNTVLQRYGGPGEGDTLVTCATIVQSYLLLITMPMGGITLGSQPVISFNYGMGDAGRIKKALRCIVGLCISFCVFMMALTYTASPLYVSLFTKDSEILARSVRYIKIFTAMIIPLAVQYPLVDETTALGQVKLALFCSAFRKLVYLASLLTLPALVSAEAAFFSEPAADVIAAAVTTALFLYFFPRVIAKRTKELGREAAGTKRQPSA